MHLLEIIFFLVSHRLEVIQKGPEVKGLILLANG